MSRDVESNPWFLAIFMSLILWVIIAAIFGWIV